MAVLLCAAALQAGAWGNRSAARIGDAELQGSQKKKTNNNQKPLVVLGPSRVGAQRVALPVSPRYLPELVSRLRVVG